MQQPLDSLLAIIVLAMGRKFRQSVLDVMYLERGSESCVLSKLCGGGGD